MSQQQVSLEIVRLESVARSALRRVLDAVRVGRAAERSDTRRWEDATARIRLLSNWRKPVSPDAVLIGDGAMWPAEHPGSVAV